MQANGKQAEGRGGGRGEDTFCDGKFSLLRGGGGTEMDRDGIEGDKKFTQSLVLGDSCGRLNASILQYLNNNF